MEILQDTTFIYITLAAVFGIFMAWGIGANDVANAMATSVGSKAITIKQAIIIAAIFEFLGAYLAGGQVTKTIRKGIVDLNAFEGNPDLLIWGMLAALLAAGTWLLIASMKGWPVSTTHSIVGAVIGFAAVGVSVDAVSWDKVGTIVMSWVVSPVLAGIIAFADGSNDVANAVGPMAAVISVAQSGELASKSSLPSWVLLVGAIGIVIGLATLGYKVMRTVGKNITELTPTRGFSAEIGAASTVVLASYTGLPISTTQTLVGAILGVGLARGIAAIDLRVVSNIFMSWVVTLPAGAFLSILFFYTLKGIFG